MSNKEFIQHEQGFNHDFTDHVLPKSNENEDTILSDSWDDDNDEDWDLLVEQVQKDFVQKYTEDGIPILPASWDDHDDDVWEAYL